MPSQHALLSPSAAARWLNCPGSVSACADIKDKGSSYAAEGTEAHALAENVLNGVDLDTVAHMYNKDMVENVQTYVDYVRSVGNPAVEQKLDMSDWIPECFGTSDAVVVREKTINIIDLKYGKGIKVYAEKNPQLMIYGLGAWSEYEMLTDIENVVLHIVQPRLDHIDTWEISISSLLSWGEWVKDRAALALSEDAPRFPGEAQCQWCKAKATCKALYDYTSKIVGAQFDDMDALESPDKLSDRKLREVLEGSNVIKSWLDAVEKHVFNLMLDGKQFKGFKLVEGRSVRKWVDIDKTKVILENLLGDKAFEHKLLSPAKAEKALGKNKKAVESLIIKPSGKPAMVPETDKRPKLENVEDQFGKL
ncbi:MAG: DUF2800 domain-containing protein [Prevotella sp.]